MKKQLAAQLVSFVSRLKYSDLSGQVVHEAKRRIIDALGCALGALGSGPEKVVQNMVLGIRSRSGGATLIGRKTVVPPDLAAFYNGTLVRYLDFNDTYLSREPCHPSDNLPVALAAAESVGRNGKDLLTALAAGYEVICRLCDAASLRRRGWDHVTYGSISSGLIAARLLGLNEQRMAHALSLSMIPNIALRQTRAGELSMWKACAFANTSRNGVFAALLARSGLSGPSDVFEGRFGFFKQVSGPFKISFPKSPRKILETSIKFYPAEYHAQSAIEAALQLRRNFATGDATEIVIETFEAACSIIGSEPEKWKPTSRETADHSLPYLVAVALMDGEVGPRQFTPTRIHSASLRRLLSKTVVRERPKFSAAYPEAIANRVTVKSKGKSWSEEVRYPRGHWKNPMSDLEVERKFMGLAKRVMKENQAEQVLEKLWSLEKIGSIRSLMSLLAVKR